MPKFLERKLKSQYGENSKIPYKIMNSIGAMKGSKETAKGREMQKKHVARVNPKGSSSKKKTMVPRVSKSESY